MFDVDKVKEIIGTHGLDVHTAGQNLQIRWSNDKLKETDDTQKVVALAKVVTGLQEAGFPAEVRLSFYNKETKQRVSYPCIWVNQPRENSTTTSNESVEELKTLMTAVIGALGQAGIPVASAEPPQEEAKPEEQNEEAVL